MHAWVMSYHKRELLQMQSFDTTSIGQVKEHVNWSSPYTTHADVYLGPLPCKFKARVRREAGRWNWQALEQQAKESGLWHP